MSIEQSDGFHVLNGTEEVTARLLSGSGQHGVAGVPSGGGREH